MQTQCIFYAPGVMWAFPWHAEFAAGAAAGHGLVVQKGLCAPGHKGGHKDPSPALAKRGCISCWSDSFP